MCHRTISIQDTVEQFKRIAPLLQYLRSLENKDSQARAQQVLTVLDAMGIKPSFQKCRHLRINNIIVDFSPDPGKKRLLFSAHYDVVKGSPGANDNASGVAVLLGLCHKLRDARIPVRIIFFDREEAWFQTRLIRFGLLGSFWYASHTHLRNIAAVYNIEFCGLGDLLVIWPIKPRDANLPALRKVEKAALELALPFRSVHIPWPLMSSDHLSFRLLGFANALSLSLKPGSQASILDELSKVSLPKLLAGRRPPLPEPLSYIHGNRDTSVSLSENSLQLMLVLLMTLIKDRC